MQLFSDLQSGALFTEAIANGGMMGVMKRVLTMVMCCAVAVDVAADPQIDAFNLEVDGANFGALREVGPIAMSRVSRGAISATTTMLPVSLQIPMTTASTSRSAITWIASFLANTRSVANARITGYSSRDLRARIALGLVDFTITQVQLPALDTSQTRQPGVLRVEGTHRRIERLEASGQLATSTSEAWRPANFRVAIDGVDATRVIAVGPIVVERSGARNIIQPFDIIVAHDDRSWHEWAEKVLVADKPDRRNVKLELLAADRRRVLATIQLDGVAVVAASHVLSQSRTELKLSAETIKLVPASATQAIDTKVPLPPKGPAPTPTPTPTLLLR